MADPIEYALKFDLAQSQSSLTALSGQVEALKARLDSTAPKIKDVKEKTEALGNANKQLSETAGRSKEAVMQLGSAVGVLNPQLGSAISLFGTMTGSIKSVTVAATELSIGSGPLFAIVAAVGLIALGWKKVSDEAKEAETRQKAAAESATKARDLYGSAEGTKVSEQFKAGTITREQAIAGLTGIVSTPATQLAAQRQQEAYLQYKNAYAASGLEGLTSGDTLEGYVPSAEEQRTLAARVAKRQSDLAAAEAALTTAKQNLVNSQADAAADEVRKLQESIDKKPKSESEKNADKLSTAAQALAAKAVSNEMARMAESLGVRADLLGAGSVFDPTVYHGFSGAYSLFGYNADPNKFSVDERARLGTGTTLNEQGVRPTSFIFNSTGTTTAPGGYTPNYAAIQKGVGIAGDAVQGNVLSAVGSAGPIGAIIAAVVGAIMAVGKLGADGVREKLDDFRETLTDGIKALPEILGEVLPDFDKAMVQEFLPALLKALPNIIGQAIRGAITNPADMAFGGKLSDSKAGWQDWAGELMTFGLAKTDAGQRNGKKNLGDVMSELISFGGNKTDLGSHAIGSARILEDGYSMLHRDELVMGKPEADAMRRGGMGGGGGTAKVDVHVYGNVTPAALDELVAQRLSAMFGPGGTGATTAPIAGGLNAQRFTG